MTLAWIAIGVVLIAVELHNLAFYALFVAVGCFVAAAVAFVAPDALALQVGAAVVVSALGLVLVRGRVSEAVAHRHEGDHRTKGVHGGLIGQEVVTLDVVGGADRVGHVRLAGERWLAVSGAELPIAPGTRVLVTAVHGTTLTVWPVSGELPAYFEPEQQEDPEPSRDGEHEQK
jgi:membrane protein implicated in regulation of membrane protease activity